MRLEQEIIRIIRPPAIRNFFQKIDLRRVRHVQTSVPFSLTCSLVQVLEFFKPAHCLLELSKDEFLKFALQAAWARSACGLRGCMGRSLLISELGSREFVSERAKKEGQRL